MPTAWNGEAAQACIADALGAAHASKPSPVNPFVAWLMEPATTAYGEAVAGVTAERMPTAGLELADGVPGEELGTVADGSGEAPAGTAPGGARPADSSSPRTADLSLPYAAVTEMPGAVEVRVSAIAWSVVSVGLLCAAGWIRSAPVGMPTPSAGQSSWAPGVPTYTAWTSKRTQAFGFVVRSTTFHEPGIRKVCPAKATSRSGADRGAVELGAPAAGRAATAAAAV